MSSIFIRFLLVTVACLLVADPCSGDALVVTRAMQASTIAEIFVDEQAVAVELEIGPAELGIFRQLLPADIRDQLGLASDEVDGDFFQDVGLVIRADSVPLPGRVARLDIRKRIARDDITGDPLPEQPDDAELVVLARLVYALGKRPQQISIHAPVGPTANIGFVAYHRGLPVNDFRYLTKVATLKLNWDDPWYSEFQNRNLRRQNAAPMSAYLYVEPYEVRKEIIIRPQDLRRFMKLELHGRQIIPVAEQAELKRRVAEFLLDKNPVTIDGQSKQPKLDRIHFIRRSLRRTGIVEPPEDLDATSAMLGVIFVYPIDALPQQVQMKWELFDELVTSIPVAASDEAGPMPAVLTPQEPLLEWQNYLKNPTSHLLKELTPPPRKPSLSISMVTVLCAVSLVPLLWISARSYKTTGVLVSKHAVSSILVAVLGMVALPFAPRVTISNPLSPTVKLSEEDMSSLIAGLLHNVYRAFDRRDPSLIYDQLEKSIGGELLEQVYLDTRNTIEIENQGGLQIKVSDVSILDMEELRAGTSESTYRVNWRVAGSVGHWGHVHERVNEPTATLTISAMDGSWKITALEMDQP